MKIKYIRLVSGSLLGMITLSGLAQNTNTNTNTLPLNQTLKYQIVFENDQALGEHAILPPGLKEKLKLTDAQRIELKPIEDDFANTSQQYQTANQPRIDAAQTADRAARLSKSDEKTAAARKQLQSVWAGLQPYRATAIIKIKPVLTPEQLAILEDPKNQWRENHAAAANDPSAN